MEHSKTRSRTIDKTIREQPNNTEGDSEVSQIQDKRRNKIEPVLDKWQQEALNHRGDLLLKTGRQNGKTFIMSRKAAMEMINYPNTRIICCSLTEDQAQLIIVMVLDYLQKNHKTYIKKGKQAPTKNKILLNNGSQILARPVGNTGDAVRGFTGDILILDEASKFNDFIFAAAKPTLMTTAGKIWMCSTPFGKKGYFYECYLNKHKRFKVIETNSWDVVHTRPISSAWTQQTRTEAIEFLDNEKLDMSEMQFAQEYLARFVDDLRQFFTDELIHKCCILKRRQSRPPGDYYLGVDIARMGEDETTFEVVEKVNNELICQRENIVRDKQLTTQTYDNILDIHDGWKFRQIGIDAGAGSLGVGILDFLLRSSVASKVQALNNRSRDLDKHGEKKSSLLGEDMFQIMRALMEKGQLLLLDDTEILQSLKSVQYEYINVAGKKLSLRMFGLDIHIAEGLKRAVYLANQKNIRSFISYM